MQLIKNLKFENYQSSSIIFLFFIFYIDIFYKISTFFFDPLYDWFTLIFITFFFIFIIKQRISGRYLFLIIIIIEFLIRFMVIDFSSDGVTYHNPARAFIGNGGNLLLSNHGDIRIDSHPTLPWVLSSFFFRLTNENTQLTFGTISLSCFFIMYIYYNFKLYKNKILNVLFSCLVSLSPVFWSQVFTGYTDYFTYALLSWSVLSFIVFNKEMTKLNFQIFCLVSCLALTSKYTSLIFYILIFSPILFIIILRKRTFYFHAKGALGFKLALTLLLCFFSLSWTYGQNLYFHKTPFPPTTLTKNVDHVADNDFYKNSPKYEHFFYSLFSETNLNTDQPNLKIPGKVYLKELKNLNFADNRFGASGPLFSLIFLLSIIVFYTSKINKIYFYFVTIITLISFCFPGTWQIRFFPLIQLIPCLVLISCNKRLLNFAILTLMIFNNTLWMIGSTYAQTKKTYEINNFVRNINSPIFISFGSWGYYKNILESKGLKMLDEKPVSSKCIPINSIYKLSLHEDIKTCQ